MTTELLKELGLDQEQIKAVMAEKGKLFTEKDAELKKMQEEKEALTEQLNSANETLKSFEGMDVEQIQKKAATLQKSFDEYKQGEAERTEALERRFIVDKVTDSHTFTSLSAKNAFKESLLAKALPFNDAKDSFIGLDDYVNEFKASDEGAFAKEKDESLPEVAASTVNGLDATVDNDPFEAVIASYQK